MMFPFRFFIDCGSNLVARPIILCGYLVDHHHELYTLFLFILVVIDLANVPGILNLVPPRVGYMQQQQSKPIVKISIPFVCGEP